ncbi:MAG: VanW family protein [Candidatus Buchananbacteria bacterium]
MLEQKNQNKIPKTQNAKKWLVLTALFLLALVCLGILAISGTAVGLELAYKDKFYPGVWIDSINAAGKTKSEIRQQLNALQDIMQNDGIYFSSADKKIKITPIINSYTDLEYTQQIITFDWDKTIDQAYALGRQGKWYQKIWMQTQTFVKNENIPIDFTLDESELKNILENNFSSLAKAPVNSQLKIINGVGTATEEEAGYIFDYTGAIEQLKNNIRALKTEEIKIASVYTAPKITKTEAENSLPELADVLALAPLTLKSADKEWIINKKQLTNLLDFVENNQEIIIGLNQEKTLAYLKTIAAEIDQEPKDAKFQMSDGKVSEFQAGQDGRALNLDLNYQKLNNQIINKNNQPFDLIIDTTQGQTAIGQVNDYGIKELIGRGTSDFKNSPTNRKINITVGAKILNGILIAPDQEFSMIKALGPIDGQHGFKQELVIKGNKTLPEYGGGLCQIGTTAFRAALYSGLPITQRKNHSYRVTYYEPAGMDATIYDPLPDLRFVNDTGNYILFTTRIEGTKLIFDFYGTKDNRKIEIAPDPPKIYNITRPGPAKYIETDTLKPGVKKKQETAHNGADTYFKYTVTYANGDVKTKEYYSHYVAWPEVWLVGITPSSTPATAEEQTAAAPAASETPAP